MGHPFDEKESIFSAQGQKNESTQNSEPENAPAQNEIQEYRFNLDEKNAVARNPRTGVPRYIVGMMFICIIFLAALVLVVRGVISRLGDDLAAPRNYAAGTPTTIEIVDFDGGQSSLNIDPEGMTSARIAETVLPSVVGISTYDGNSVLPIAKCSGIIFSRDGNLITSAAFLKNAAAISVNLQDGTTYSAKLIGTDALSDLAVLKIEATNLIPATFGDAEQCLLGDRIVALGRPGGEYAVVSEGNLLANALGKQRIRLVQTNTVLGSGNAGGALVNRHGQVIGILSGAFGSSEEGGCVAVTINYAKPIIESILQNGFAFGVAGLGVTLSPLNDAVASLMDLPSEGLAILSLKENSPFIEKGIQEGDVLIKAAGEKLARTEQLLEILDQYDPGDEILLEVYKKDTKHTVQLRCVLIEEIL